MKDDNLSQALSVMKKYSGADELTQAMVQELIEKVVVMDLEHVEIVWKFKDEVRYFIGIRVYEAGWMMSLIGFFSLKKEWV